MNTQYLQYVREQLMVATADLSGETKGQLLAWLENAQFDSNVEYSTASWRRAVLSLDEHYKAWLLWNYSENTCWEHQVEITQWGWSAFAAQLDGKKMAGKTQERLRALIWLAAQDVKSELAGREVYQYKELAGLVGVSEKNWSETFTRHWLTMRAIFLRLDQASLLSVSESRSEQVAFNLYALN